MLKFVEKRPNGWSEHVLNADVVVGRVGCDIELSDGEVSRRHAALRVTPQGPAVEDLGSSNGTFVNGRRITGLCQLNDGDVVRFGKTEWQLTADRPAAAEPPAAPPTPPGGPAAPPAAAAREARGDVPAPPEVTPSAVRRTLPPDAASQPPAFTPVAAQAVGGSAATHGGYTLFCYAMIVATLIGVGAYFIVN